MSFGNGAQEAADAQEQAARQAEARYREATDKGMQFAKDQYGLSREDLEKYFGKSTDYLSPYTNAGQTALDNYMAGLGLNPNISQEDIYAKFRNSPGYQAALEQGQKSRERSAAARGMTQSGALLKELTKYGQDYADQRYNQYMDRLGNMAGMGANLSQFNAGNAMQTGNSLAGMGTNLANIIAQMYGNQGENAANSELAIGNARASGYLNSGSNNFLSGVGSVLGGFLGGGGGSNIGSAVSGFLGGR